MKKLKIYHNPKCSKSRETLKLIEEANLPVDIVLYLETPPTFSELNTLLDLLKLEPEQITRKSEERYKELKISTNPPVSREKWIELLIENPILIERPIVCDEVNAVLGRPPENVKILF